MTKNETIQWQTLSFAELNTQDVYDIFKLRQDVFIIEQSCLYQDFDGKDFTALHLIGRENGQLVAYLRLFAENDYFANHCSFGRVVTSPRVRGNGCGKLLIKKAIEVIKQRWPNTPCKISAQSYLGKFYSSFGFARIGNEYLEDNIPHIAMIKPAITQAQPSQSYITND